MSHRRVKHIILFFFLIGAVRISSGDGYVVQKGDTLSEIFYRKFGASLFQKKNWIHRVLAANPKIKDPDVIFAGQRIQIPDIRIGKVRIVSPDSKWNEEQAQAVIDLNHDSEIRRAPAQLSQSDDDGDKSPVRSVLGTDLGFEYFRIDSTDKATGAQSVYLSNLSPQYRMTWDLQWSHEWSTRIQMSSISQRILRDETTPTINIENARSSRFAFLIGAEKNWNEFQRTSFFLNYKERVFSHATTATNLVIDRVGSLSFRGQHEVEVFRKHSASLAMNLAGELIAPGSGPGYSTKFGYGADLGLSLKHQFKSLLLSGTVYYGMIDQDSDFVEQKETHLGAFMGLSWFFEE